MLYSKKPLIYISDRKAKRSLLNIFALFEIEEKEIYLVGGCVRDMLLGKTPKDYDLCTNATPDEIKDIFDGVGVKFEIIETGLKHGTLTIWDKEVDNFYEITTYRIDGDYKDNRHPTEVTFTPSLEEDLKRRDFTINSFAYDLKNEIVYMLDESYLDDLHLGIIRTVGNPEDRFNEDALRMLRAIRFAAQLGFSIDKDTYKAITNCNHNLEKISKERIRDELTKIIMSDNSQMLELFSTTGLEKYAFDGITPISDMINCDHQNPWHYTDVFHHTMDVVKKVSKCFELRWAALLHDVGKPKVKKLKPGTTDHYRYIGHPEESAKITDQLMDILKFSNDQKETIHNFVLHHDYPLSKCSLVKFKKMLVKLGKDRFLDFLKLREADALAHKLELSTDFAIDAISIVKARYASIINNKEPLELKDLAINGDDLLALGYQGKEIGDKLNSLLEDVLAHPENNIREILLNKCRRKN